ncbi:MAG: hypothetical protein JSU84_00830 [Thiotrichales bacterium]|nr:MAG: hypothetical protein JSU84_00830 [Thiotrichales bacterium]
MCDFFTKTDTLNGVYIETPFFTKHGDFIGFHEQDSRLSDLGDTVFKLSSYGVELNKQCFQAIRETIKPMDVDLSADFSLVADKENHFGLIQAITSIYAIEPFFVRKHLFHEHDDAKKKAEEAITQAARAAGYRVNHGEHVTVLGKRLKMAIGIHTPNNEHQIYAEVIANPLNNANGLYSALAKMTALKTAGYSDKSRMAFFTGETDELSRRLMNDVAIISNIEYAEQAFAI